MSINNYIVATIKPWNIEAFKHYSEMLGANWHLVSSPDELSPDLIDKLRPRYIFFPHWSWIVPKAILNRAECVCFHMADVPYGRGGSPLQNLIARGHKDTKLTALRMTTELDAGPIYLQRPLSLLGSAHDIFIRAASLCIEMMQEIAQNEPSPTEQKGIPVIFQRRAPEMSALPDRGNLENLYDHIRMLDAPTYPKAFLNHGDFNLSFSQAERTSDGSLIAHVIIRKNTHDT